MYPAQTSLIPVTVALARFLEVNGAGGVYPFWYLETTPFKYLTGPAVPYLLVSLQTVLPSFSYFDLAFVLIVAGLVIEAVGWGMLALRLRSGSSTGVLSGNRRVGWLVGILVLIMPWHIVSALGLTETSAVVAGALTPWVLLAFIWGPVSRFLPVDARSGLNSSRNQKDNAELRVVGNPSTTATPFSLSSIVNGQWSIVFPAIAFALLLLTNTTVAVPAIVGILILVIVGNFAGPVSSSSHPTSSSINNRLRVLDGTPSAAATRKGDGNSLEQRLLFFISVLLLGWVLTLWWYSPSYWLTVWGAPGIGGNNIVGVLTTLINFMRGFLPVIAAVLIVSWKIKPKTVFAKFSLGWIVIFGSLTLFRFISDWDFWMDWTAWMGEVEVGLVLLIAGPVSRFLPVSAPQPFSSKIDNPNPGTKSKKSWVRAVGNPSTTATRNTWLVLVIGIYLFFGWFLAWQNRGFWLPRVDIAQTVEYKIAGRLNDSVNCQQSTVNCPTVFLSGTSAFWLNSLVDVKQVRGGRDEGSVDLRWREAVWEVREGVSALESVRVLKSLGVDFLVVHTDKSREYYHDFKYPRKFEGQEELEKVYEKDGDVIYQIR